MAVNGYPAAIYLIALFYLTFTGYANATASLEILPSGDTQTKPIGSSIIITCQPNVDNIRLITNMQWLDPQNRVIESLKHSLAVIPIGSTPPLVHGHSNPAMYTELHQDSSLSLFFHSLQEEQAGKYTCMGTFASSVHMNKSVTIDTIVAITFDDAPENQYPVLGEDYSILCKVRARPSPSVDWLYNGELVKTNDRYIIDTHALKIKNVQESDDGIYTCRASVLTTGELKERPIRVEVHIKPTIEERTTPVDIIEGETQKIECKAKGKPPPEYTWVKSLTKQNLESVNRFTVNRNNGDMVIESISREDAGEYQCTATNAAGLASTNIVVNVIVKPKIMEFQNVTVILGNEVDLKCKAFGKPPPKVTFKKLEETYVIGPQPNNDKIVLINKQDEVLAETEGILNIRDISRSTDGIYGCVAENAGGKAYTNGHITVEFPPTFIDVKNNTMWSWDSRPVNLTCTATSIPNATITWLMSGNIKIENVREIKQYGNGPVSTIMVIPIDTRYYTNYKCIAANKHGIREHIIELRQATKPGELLQVKRAEITATTIKFDLVPPPSHQDLPIKSIIVQYKEEPQTWANARNRTWSMNSVYVLEGLKPQTPYNFRFAAINIVGQGNWGGSFRETTPVRTVPNAPKIITNKLEPNGYDISTYSNQYELFWTVPVDNGEPIDKYIVKYCQVRRETGDWIPEEDTCKILEIKGAGRTKSWLQDMYSDTYYTVEVRAHNAMGLSNPGVAKFKTSTGPDTKVVHHYGPLISSAAIIGIVIAVLFIIIIIIDVICCCAHKTGIIYYICERSRRKPVDEEDSKLGRDEKVPLKEEKKITPIIDSGLRRETSVTFDGKRSVSKTGFVGKDSAV